MQYGTFLSTTCSSKRLCALLATLLLIVGMLASCPASQADAAESPGTPLGLGARSRSMPSDGFAGQKLGVDTAAGQRLWAPSAPRVFSEVESGGYVSYDEETPSYAASDEAASWEAAETSYEEPSATEETWVSAEPAYEEPVYEEPQIIWDSAVASAYSPDCNGGTTTSSGIPLDWETPTVASTWIPLGSYIEISYEGMTVVAQVTDRGPYIAGRELDLSPGVIYAFGFGGTDDWGVRTVSYRLL